ncbi:MAG: bifunctional diguanylate cyclase/phosphodiesterase [Pseudomonadales bacterium]
MDEPNKSKIDLLEEIKSLRTELASVKRTKEQRTAELYKSEERFALAMRGASDGLWDWNLETNEVYYSPRWKSMLGYTEDELENKLDTWSSLTHCDDKDDVLQRVHDYLSGKTSAFEVEMRMYHKSGHYIFIRSRAFKAMLGSSDVPARLIGTHVDITLRKKAEIFDHRNTNILEMIAKGVSASKIYNEIGLLYEERNPGMRCSMLELDGNTLLHGGAPSLPKEYCDAVNGLKNGPNIGSCGTSTYTGKRVLVENIDTDPKWACIKHHALPHGMRCCWSEPIKSSSGKVLGAFGMYYNFPSLPNEHELNDLISAGRLTGIIMEREHNQKLIRNLAYTDKLTRLSSRAHLYLHLKSLINNSLKHNNPFSVLYIDLDNFKHVNDSLGHDSGDYLLQEVAKRLKSITREIDFVARLGGDEFCIVIKDVIDNAHIADMAQRYLDIISIPADFSGRTFIPTCSIGAARYPNDGDSLQALLKAADTALYAAKDYGKNRFAFYNKELTQKAEHRFKVEQCLREAIEQQLLTLVYQPQVDITTGEIIGVEALSRWKHPQLGQVPPADFIPIAERIGMIKPLTEWALRTASIQSVSWKQAGLPAMRMAVNISPSHFLENDLAPMIKRVINNTGMPAAELKLEITESAVQTSQKNLSIFKELKQLGTLLAIDDFGTGYSSFASLKHLDVDFLKIDKHFIDDMLVDKKTRLLIGSMIEMGHNLEYKIIAEGVESTEQLSMLKKLGCDHAQGYLFSKPVDAEEISNLLKQQQVN